MTDLALPEDWIYAYLGGEAGTGKTFAAREYAADRPEVELCASTGIAAINLGGTTINSLLKYFDTESLEQSFLSGWLQTQLHRRARNGLTHYLLDECSMVEAKQLDTLCLAIDMVNADLIATDHPPIRLTLVGDFAQLPPVEGKYAFRSSYWPQFADHTIKLTEIRRQQDRDFILALQAIRRGERGDQLDLFAPCFTRTIDTRFDGLTLLPTNAEVDRVNALRYLELQTREICFETRRWGKARAEWKQIPDIVRVKPGALVMILANKIEREDEEDRGEYLYVNGDLAHVNDVDESHGVSHGNLWVTLLRTGQERRVEYVSRELIEDVSPTTGAKKRQSVGSVNYMPVRLAYATTVHKAQGLSFDQVQLGLGHRFWKAPSMMYVACSRARTLAGLHIAGSLPLMRNMVTTSKEIQPWL